MSFARERGKATRGARSNASHLNSPLGTLRRSSARGRSQLSLDLPTRSCVGAVEGRGKEEVSVGPRVAA